MIVINAISKTARIVDSLFSCPCRFGFLVLSCNECFFLFCVPSKFDIPFGKGHLCKTINSIVIKILLVYDNHAKSTQIVNLELFRPLEHQLSAIPV